MNLHVCRAPFMSYIAQVRYRGMRTWETLGRRTSYAQACHLASRKGVPGLSFRVLGDPSTRQKPSYYEPSVVMEGRHL